MTGSHSLLTTKFLIQVHNQIYFLMIVLISKVNYSDILLLTIIVNGQLSPKISFHQGVKTGTCQITSISPNANIHPK